MSLNSQRRGQTARAAMMSFLMLAGAGMTTGAVAAPQPGISEVGLNVWAISSTPLTESITVDQKAREALPSAIRDAGVLRIGAITDEPPFVLIEDGELQGIDIDMMGGIARALGLKVELDKTSFDGMIPGLQSNRFDVIMGDLTDTAPREKVVSFVDYLENAQTVIVRKTETRDFSKPLNLCGYAAAAPKGSLSMKITTELSEICTAKGLKPIAIQTYPGSAPGFLALDLGRADVVPITYAIATYLVKLHPEKYTLTDNLFYKSFKGAAVLKEREDLLKALTHAFQTVIDSPNYQRVLEHWGLRKIGVDKAIVNVPGEPLSKSIY